MDVSHLHSMAFPSRPLYGPIANLLNKFLKHPRLHSQYEGKPIGIKTTGDYGSLPRPAPVSHFFFQGKLDGFVLFTGLFYGIITMSAWFGPVFWLPLWIKHRGYLKEASDNYGPTKYGKGAKDIL